MNIAIIDNDPVLLEQFSSYFSDQPDIQCTESTLSVEEFLAKLPLSMHIDYILLDIHLSFQTSLSCIPNLRKALPDTEIIMFTVDENPAMLIEAFQLGAVGYLLKKVKIEEIKDFFDIAKKGGAIMSAEMVIALVKKNSETPVKSTGLTIRELEVLTLLAEGWGYKHIADKTGLSIDGVRLYIKRIYRAMNINSKGEAINKFYKGEFPAPKPIITGVRKGRPPLL
jgi:DNA-binding NarL/FixJ family response regulator